MEIVNNDKKKRALFSDTGGGEGLGFYFFGAFVFLESRRKASVPLTELFHCFDVGFELIIAWPDVDGHLFHDVP